MLFISPVQLILLNIFILADNKVEIWIHCFSNRILYYVDYTIMYSCNEAI